MRPVFKMKFFLLSMLGFLFVWGPSFVWAEAESLGSGVDIRRAVNLQDLLGMARQKSPGLMIKKYEYEAARSRVIGAFLPMDPMIGVDVESQPRVFDFGERMDNEYMIEQTIPFPTKLFLKGTIASREADIAYQKFLEEEKSLRWHIEQPYYEMFLAQKTLEALEENQTLLEKLAQAVKARYESNQISQDDLLKVQIELSKNAIEVFNWRERVHIQEAHFSHQLDESLETRYVIVNDGERAPFSLTRPELERAAIAKRPELKAFEIGIQRARDNRSLVTTEWLPDITLRYEGRQFKGEDSVSEHDTSIRVTVPVWSLIAGIGGVWKSSEDEVKAAEAMYVKMKNEVFLAIHEAFSKVKAADNALRIYENAILPQAKQQVEVALASYEASRADFLAVIDAQRTLKNTQIEYYRAVAEYEMGLSDLRLAVGQDLASVKGDLS
ncbi:MAG: TolC family protein [Candidatus Omnitrophota bacterium]